MKEPRSGGGWQAIRHSWCKARQAGGLWKMWTALRRKNVCKTCALGMGGQQGGMVNEAGRFPEVCKKAFQAMAADMQGAVADDFWSRYSVSQLAALSSRELDSCGRLVRPVLLDRGADHYRPIDWEEALDRIARRLRSLPPAETFWYVSGRSSNEAGFLLQLFGRVYGTNHISNCSYYCHQASGVGLKSSIGSGTSTIVLEDLEQADLVFLIGGNPPSNHPRLMTSLMHVRQAGGEIVVINPVVEAGLVRFRVPSHVGSMLFGTEIATSYVQPHVSGDLALLTGIAKRVVELRAHDESFLREHCEGSEAWLGRLGALSWGEIEAKSGVPFEQIDVVARKYAAARNVVFGWTLGITQHEHGVQNVQAIANLALLRGMVGRRQAGLMPIRGHSNVQGLGSMGVTPGLQETVFERLQSRFGVRLPTGPGLDTLGCMEAAHGGALKMGFCLGGNLYGSNPDARFAAEALARLQMLVYLNTTLNTSHARGRAEETLILPVRARDEEGQATTQESLFNRVRLSEGGPPRLEGPRGEVEVIANLARRVLGTDGPIDWRAMEDTGRIRAGIAAVVPGFEEMAGIDRTRQEFQVGGRTLHEPRFPTASGRAVLHGHDLPDLRGGGDSLRLMTVRSEGQFNTVVYDEEDLYRGQDRRDVILLHPDDIRRLGFLADDRVTVRSECGRMTGLLLRAFGRIKPGNALMYFPEANALVPRRADPRSRTPAFKCVPVTIEKEG